MFYMHLLHLFTFSWTNLLTRCLVPVSRFLLFFVSENLHRKYSRNCTGRKPPTLYCRHVHGHRRRDAGGAVESPHHLAARVPPPTREEVVWGPQDSPGVSPSPIYTSSTENPKYPIIILRKVPSPPSSSSLDREGYGALPSTLPEGRSSPEGSTSPCLPPV